MKKIFKYIGLILLCMPYTYHFPIYSNGKLNFTEILLYAAYIAGVTFYVKATSDQDDW